MKKHLKKIQAKAKNLKKQIEKAKEVVSKEAQIEAKSLKKKINKVMKEK
jgi:hypothetical protein